MVTNGVELSPVQMKALETTKANALTLWEQGYTIAPSRQKLVYVVTAPARLIKATGEMYTATYVVDLAGETCTCPQFANCNNCKHLIASRIKVQDALTLLLPKHDDYAGLEPFSTTFLYPRVDKEKVTENDPIPPWSSQNKPWLKCVRCGQPRQGKCQPCLDQMAKKGK